MATERIPEVVRALGVAQSLVKEKEQLSACDHDIYRNYWKATEVAPSLRPHQVESIKWLLTLALRKYRGAYLTHGTGRGKTATIIAFGLEYWLMTNSQKPILILVPLSLLGQWRSEFQNRFNVATDQVYVHHGRENRVEAAVDLGQEWSNSRYFDGQHFVVATYDDLTGEAKKYDEYQVKMRSAAVLNKGRGVLDSLPLPVTPLTPLLSAQFAMVVMDEAQTMKNFDGTVFEAAMRMKAKFKVMATATPLENNYSKLNIGSA
ncbi:hypothetical protein LTR72_006134 [Exophiala xenobiotica]|nr:hypothetical protein LTR72_006134 [Exophiala xenobiotica]KAK5294915.1 hypothetical protein LTR14_004083 [Exophiala xenobiotica]KAK5483046.1 hypothetical protein LTR55_006446 [Exophiala xenobiotica]